VYLSSFGVAQKFPDTQDYNYLRQVYLENATVRGRAWYKLLDAVVLTLDVTL